MDEKQEDVAGLSKAVQSFRDTAMVAIVKDADDFKRAGDDYNMCLAYEKRVHVFCDDRIRGAHELHKSLVAMRDTMLAPVAEAKAHIRAEMKRFSDEQERIRREAQAKAEAEIRKKMEDATIALAAKMESNGDAGKANALLNKPVPVPTITFDRTLPTGFGHITRRVWKAEIIDLMALVKAVAAGQIPLQAVRADEAFIGAQARSLKNALAYPGVRVTEQ